MLLLYGLESFIIIKAIQVMLVLAVCILQGIYVKKAIKKSELIISFFG